MKRMLLIATAAISLTACTAQNEIATVPINYAFVDAGDTLSRELGLNVDNCEGKFDYEIEVEEGAEALTITVLHHGDTTGGCTDTFTVHLDSPPHGKKVIDGTSARAVEVRTD